MEGEMLLVELAAEGLGGGFEEGGGGDGVEEEGRLSGAHASDVEEVVDERVEAVGIGAGGGEEFAVAKGKALVDVVGEEMDGHLEGGEGRFEFVGDGGEEA